MFKICFLYALGMINEQFFVHISECIDEIKEGNKVSFDTVKGTKGLNAVKVKVIG